MIPGISLLSPSDLKKIHNASLEILDTVGVRIDSKDAVEIYRSAGARIEDGNIVKIDSSIIQSTLDHCRPRCSLYHRQTGKEMVLGDGVIKHSVVGWMADILDWRTGEHRKAVLEDLAETVKICDALDEISWFMSPLVCSDVPGSDQELYQFKVAVEHSNKPIILSVSDADTLKKIFDLAAMISGSEDALREKPTFAVALGLMSPLLITLDLCEVAMLCAQSGVPVFLYTSSMAGATSPVTLSGTLAGNHAETLAAIALIKSVNPKAPIIYNSYSKPFDMKSSDVSPGSPEFGLMMAGITQLGKSINLPTGTGMFMTDSSSFDIQAGLEKMGGSILPLMSGADFSSGMGMLGKAVVHSIEALVSDAEAAAYLRRMVRGVGCSPEQLAVDVYREVKPLGNFLTTKHTMDHFRKELWDPRVTCRKSFSSWMLGGKTLSMRVKIHKYIETQLDQDRSPDLPDQFYQAFDRMVGGGSSG